MGIGDAGHCFKQEARRFEMKQDIKNPNSAVNYLVKQPPHHGVYWDEALQMSMNRVYRQ